MTLLVASPDSLNRPFKRLVNRSCHMRETLCTTRFPFFPTSVSYLHAQLRSANVPYRSIDHPVCISVKDRFPGLS